MRRDTFKILDQSVNAELRVYFDQQMHVVWHDFESDDFRLIAKTDFVQQMLEPEGDFIHKNGATIFRSPDNMILAAVHDVVVRFVAF